MKTLKSILLSSLFLLSCLSSIQAFGHDDGHRPEKTKSLKAQVVDLVQEPHLLDHGLTEATVDIKFKINEAGEILLQELSSEYQFLIDFVRKKLHRQEIDVDQDRKNQVYYLQINFLVQ